jgi:hypothetical protein
VTVEGKAVIVVVAVHICGVVEELVEDVVVEAVRDVTESAEEELEKEVETATELDVEPIMHEQPELSFGGGCVASREKGWGTCCCSLGRCKVGNAK